MIYLLEILEQQELLKICKIMNKLYKDYLVSSEVLTEEEFLKEIEGIPFSDDVTFDNYYLPDSVTDYLIQESLYPITIDDINYNNKEVVLSDVNSEEEFDEAKELLNKYGWKISNEEEILEEFEEEKSRHEEELYLTKINKLLENMSAEKLEEIYEYLKDAE